MKKIAVFASGNGSNFQVIAEEFPVEFVFSDHRDAYVLERAEKLGVLSYAFELKEFENKVDYEAALVELLEEHQIDLICLAGYMKIVGPALLAAYEGRIINIHPALLPKFGGKGMWGMHVHTAVIDAKEKESGATVHFVTAGIDEGEIILQGKVAVNEGDTPEKLAEKVHGVEYEIFPKAIKKVLEQII